MEVCGRIRRIYHKERMFEIKGKQRLEYYFLSRSLIKKFNAYLCEGLFVHFTCKEQKVLHGGMKAYEVISFTKMVQTKHRSSVIYFDMNTIKEALKKVLNRDGNKMFLDMEFTMPPREFSRGTPFTNEIIQYGMEIEHENGQDIDEDCTLVKPKNHTGNNERTFDFIGITENDMKIAISYKKFYLKMKAYLELYDPTIYVWGKNDILVLNASYQLHRLKPLAEREKFINLMQLMKNYLGQKSDIGLFNALSYFGEEVGYLQTHNPLDDARVTRMVFHTFKNCVNIKVR